MICRFLRDLMDLLLFIERPAEPMQIIYELRDPLIFGPESYETKYLIPAGSKIVWEYLNEFES